MTSPYWPEVPHTFAAWSLRACARCCVCIRATTGTISQHGARGLHAADELGDLFV